MPDLALVTRIFNYSTPSALSIYTLPNPLMASLLQTRSRGWPLKGLGLASPDYQVGAHFEALDEGILVAAFKSTGYFFPISISLEVR